MIIHEPYAGKTGQERAYNRFLALAKWQVDFYANAQANVNAAGLSRQVRRASFRKMARKRRREEEAALLQAGRWAAANVRRWAKVWIGA